MNPRFDVRYIDKRLQMVNDVILGFARIGRARLRRKDKEINDPFRHVISLAEKLRRRPIDKLVEIESSNDKCVHRIMFDLTKFGFEKPVVYNIYTSAQESPIRPYQLEQKYSRLMKQVKKYNEVADTFNVMLLPRLTGSLNEKLSKKAVKIHGKKYKQYKGVIILNEDKELSKELSKAIKDQLVEIIINYFKNRLNKLIASIKGKRIWGIVALMVLALTIILKSFGIKPEGIDIYVETKLEQAIDEPMIIFH